MTNIHPAAFNTGRSLLADLPNLPLMLHLDLGWTATEACDPDRPFVVLSPQRRGVEIYARPRAGVFTANIGFTLFVRYPLYDSNLIDDPNADHGFARELRAAVEAKCAELGAQVGGA